MGTHPHQRPASLFKSRSDEVWFRAGTGGIIGPAAASVAGGHERLRCSRDRDLLARPYGHCTGGPRQRGGPGPHRQTSAGAVDACRSPPSGRTPGRDGGRVAADPRYHPCRERTATHHTQLHRRQIRSALPAASTSHRPERAESNRTSGRASLSTSAPTRPLDLSWCNAFGEHRLGPDGWWSGPHPAWGWSHVPQQHAAALIGCPERGHGGSCHRQRHVHQRLSIVPAGLRGRCRDRSRVPAVAAIQGSLAAGPQTTLTKA